MQLVSIGFTPQRFGLMATGYCFGAPFVMDVGGTDDIVAGALAMIVIVYPSVKYIHKLLGAFAHPGLLTEKHFQDLKRTQR